jgi:hypothetical protein
VGEIPRRASPPRDDNAGGTLLLMALKVLNCSLVFLGRRFCFERAEIPTLSCLGIFLPRIQPIFSGPNFSDHDSPLSRGNTMPVLRPASQL